MNHESHYGLLKPQINLIMGGLMVGLLVAAFDYSIMATAMPNVIKSLNGMEYYVWPFTAYMLTSTISIILFGKLSDIYGRKHVLISGIITFVISSVMCGFSTNMIELIIFRGLHTWWCNYRYHWMEVGIFYKCSSWNSSCNHSTIFTTKLQIARY